MKKTKKSLDSETYKDAVLEKKMWDIFYGAVSVGTPIYAYRKISELNELEKEYRHIQLGGESYGGNGAFPPYLKVYNPQIFAFSRIMTGVLGLTGPTAGALRLGGVIQKRKKAGGRRTSST